MELVKGRVMVFGTFDVLHPGHKFFVNKATQICELHANNANVDPLLIVVIARDKTVKRIKPLLRNSEQVRLQVLQEAFSKATVILGDEENPMKVLQEYRPEMVCLGYDQVGFSEELREQYPEVKIERIDAYQPEKYKSSLM